MKKNNFVGHILCLTALFILASASVEKIFGEETPESFTSIAVLTVVYICICKIIKYRYEKNKKLGGENE